MKTLLISGDSYSLVYNDLEEEICELFHVDKIVNLSEAGASPDRQIRVVIEWIAQNGKPDMVMVPVSHYNRFDLPIANKFDSLHNLHTKCSWSSSDVDEEKLNDILDPNDVKQYLKSGAMIHKIEHTIHDYLFVKLLTFQAYLQQNDIRHLIFDSCNSYKELWMEFLSIDDENQSGYQPGMKKRDLLDQCPGVYKLLSFCGNAWMYEQLSESQKHNYHDLMSGNKVRYPADANIQATTHFHPEETLKLLTHLQKEGAVYG